MRCAHCKSPAHESKYCVYRRPDELPRNDMEVVKAMQQLPGASTSLVGHNSSKTSSSSSNSPENPDSSTESLDDGFQRIFGTYKHVDEPSQKKDCPVCGDTHTEEDPTITHIVQQMLLDYTDWVNGIPTEWNVKKAEAIAQLHQHVQAAFDEGRQVGQYQAANKMYGHVTEMWLFKDNNPPVLNSVRSAESLLKDCEAFMNDNAAVYQKYLAQLKANITSKGE